MASVTPNTPSTTSSTAAVKAATPQYLVIKDDLTPIEVMTDLVFENLGGHELVNIVRSDIVNGQNVIYQPIKNLSKIAFQYNPQNILNLQNIDSSYFKKFQIDLYQKVESATGSNVYLDSSGNLVIEITDLAADEQVEVQVLSNGAILNDTIY